MSELKDYRITTRSNNVFHCYIKSEADKVIAELKDKLQNVSELLNETREWLIESQKLHNRCADNASKVIRHHKYKRCVDEAKICQLRIERLELYLTKHKDCRSSIQRWQFLKSHCEKWRKRWLKIAEKFKSNNEVNNG